MPQCHISTTLNSNTYFLTMTIQRWYYLFDRYNRWEILADSIRYCQKNKELELNRYVFMLNHLHIIATAPDVIGFVRDFKRFTAKQFKLNLEKTEPTVLPLFIDEESRIYQFWRKGNASKLVESSDFYRQKLNYIHNNPVRKGYVAQPEHWIWSSANPKSPLVVTMLQ